jgi:hypothetical protein
MLKILSVVSVRRLLELSTPLFLDKKKKERKKEKAHLLNKNAKWSL